MRTCKPCSCAADSYPVSAALNSSNAAAAVIDVDGRVLAVANYDPGGVRLFDAHTLEPEADVVAAIEAAGGKVVEDTALSIGGTGALFGELHPRENAEVLAQVSKVVSDLVDAGKQLVNA